MKCHIVFLNNKLEKARDVSPTLQQLQQELTITENLLGEVEALSYEELPVKDAFVDAIREHIAQLDFCIRYSADGGKGHIEGIPSTKEAVK